MAKKWKTLRAVVELKVRSDSNVTEKRFAHALEFAIDRGLTKGCAPTVLSFLTDDNSSIGKFRVKQYSRMKAAGVI